MISTMATKPWPIILNTKLSHKYLYLNMNQREQYNVFSGRVIWIKLYSIPMDTFSNHIETSLITTGKNIQIATM